MKVTGKFDHFNINVTNLNKSIEFYQKALGLQEDHRKEAPDGSFILVYLSVVGHPSCSCWLTSIPASKTQHIAAVGTKPCISIFDVFQFLTSCENACC